MRAYSSDKDSPTWKKEMGKAGTFDLVLENENMYGIIILFLPMIIGNSLYTCLFLTKLFHASSHNSFYFCYGRCKIKFGFMFLNRKYYKYG